MKQVDTNQQLIRVVPNVNLQFTTGRYTQISKDESEVGGMLQRGKSFSSTYVKNPFIVVSINPIDPITGERNLDLLRRLYATSTIYSFSTFAGTDRTANNGERSILPNFDSPGVQSDPFQIDADLYATKGRLEFDIEKYPTAQIGIEFRTSHIGVPPFNLNIFVDVFSRDENIRSIPAIAKQETNKLLGRRR